MITVGTNSFGYNQVKNFTGLPFHDVRYKKVKDVYKAIAHVHFKLRNKVVNRYINRFNDFGLSRVDLYHFFNTITPVRKPWIVTFETTLPRLEPAFVKGYEWLAGKYCKRIIAISQRAYNAQAEQLGSFPEYRSTILDKTVVIHPAQKLVINDINDKRRNHKITLTFIGSAFFRKGGWELLKAFTSVSKDLPLHLNIVSRLECEGYMDDHATSEVISQTKQVLSEGRNISYYRTLPNKQVMQLLQKSDVGILPSYAETYGYSVLEAMSCGCAVITTDLSPFNEFVKDDWGWLLKVPKYIKNGIEYPAITSGKADEDRFSNALVNELISTLRKLADNPDVLRIKQQNAINAIQTEHNAEVTARIIKDIYKQAAGN